MNETRKEMWKNVYNKFKKERCNEKGEIKEKNLTKEEIIGMKKLKKRKKEGRTVVVTSDKGKKMTISTIECYERQGRKQIKDDRKVEEKEKKKDVRGLDELGRQVAEIFKVGEERGPGNSA